MTEGGGADKQGRSSAWLVLGLLGAFVAVLLLGRGLLMPVRAGEDRAAQVVRQQREQIKVLVRRLEGLEGELSLVRSATAGTAEEVEGELPPPPPTGNRQVALVAPLELPPAPPPSLAAGKKEHAILLQSAPTPEQVASSMPQISPELVVRSGLEVPTDEVSPSVLIADSKPNGGLNTRPRLVSVPEAKPVAEQMPKARLDGKRIPKAKAHPEPDLSPNVVPVPSSKWTPKARPQSKRQPTQGEVGPTKPAVARSISNSPASPEDVSPPELAALSKPSSRNLVPRTAADFQREQLVKAAGTGLAGLVENLLDLGVPVSAQGEGGRTALHEAAAHGHLRVMRLLLARGAELDARDQEGRTPLMEAIDRETLLGVEALLRAGARVLAKDIFGVSTLRLASRCDHSGIRDLVIAAVDPSVVPPGDW
jgi:hypothetical protein